MLNRIRRLAITTIVLNSLRAKQLRFDNGPQCLTVALGAGSSIVYASSSLKCCQTSARTAKSERYETREWRRKAWQAHSEAKEQWADQRKARQQPEYSPVASESVHDQRALACAGRA